MTLFKFRVGDKILKDGYPVIYQEVVGMTRTPRQTRCVEGYSQLCPEGERGDTYIGDVTCLLSPDLWECVKALGWPADISEVATKYIDCHRDGTTFPVLTLADAPSVFH